MAYGMIPVQFLRSARRRRKSGAICSLIRGLLNVLKKKFLFTVTHDVTGNVLVKKAC